MKNLILAAILAVTTAVAQAVPLMSQTQREGMDEMCSGAADIAVGVHEMRKQGVKEIEIRQQFAEILRRQQPADWIMEIQMEAVDIGMFAPNSRDEFTIRATVLPMCRIRVRNHLQKF